MTTMPIVCTPFVRTLPTPPSSLMPTIRRPTPNIRRFARLAPETTHQPTIGHHEQEQSIVTHLLAVVHNLEKRLQKLEQQHQHQSTYESSTSQDGPTASPIPAHTPKTLPRRITPITNNFTGMPDRIIASSKTPIPAQSSSMYPIELTNRFSECDDDDIISGISDSDNGSSINNTISSHSNICSNNNDNENNTPNCSNGEKSKVGVVADSTCGRIKVRDFNYKLGLGEEAVFEKFPGATARQIGVYSQHMKVVEKPETLIVIAGTNDLGKSVWELEKFGKEIDTKAIANDIMNIGRDAQNHGVGTIYVSSLLRRRGLKYEELRRQINMHLETYCNVEGIHFLSHENIYLSDLWVDGLHLNSGGIQKLMDNMLRCCTTYNPYLCD